MNQGPFVIGITTYLLITDKVARR